MRRQRRKNVLLVTPGCMSGYAYYEYQSTARGLNSSADVEGTVDWIAPCYQRFLPRWLPTDKRAAIYEVACGPGIMLRYLKRQGYINLSGSDSASCQIALARAAGLSVVEADSLKELERHPDGKWDRIIAIDFIEHISKDDLIRFLALSYRTLKPGGSLILRAPNGDSPFVGRNLFNDITHVWAYTTIALQALFQMAGFQKVEFADESMAMVMRHRWLKMPLMRLSQAIFRILIRMTTRENIRYLNPSIYIAAWK